MNQNRRTFMFVATATGLSVCGVSAVSAQTKAATALPMLDVNDATAKALGYVVDTTKVDAKKYPQHKKEQKCSNCTLYTGKATDKAGPCTLFPGKQVAGDGWCVSWAAKAKK
jgi:High potential iron-sulfur protein